MNDLIIATSALTMSTLEIAGLAEKRHDNVLRDVRAMYLKLGLSLKTEEKATTGGRPIEIAHLAKRETLILVSGYSVELRARIVDRWMELEAVVAQAAAAPLTVEAFAEEARKVVGGIVKGIVHKEMSEVIPALVARQVAETQVAVVHGVTAGEIMTMAGIRDRKGMRGLARTVSDRMRNFCARQGAVVKYAELGASHAYVFDPQVARQWLSDGGKAEIEKRVAERKGQGVLKLVRTKKDEN